MPQQNSLEELRKLSVIVADTGEISLIKKLKPEDATTNPSLILKAASKEEYQYIIESAVKWAKKRQGSQAELAEDVMDRLAVNFGLEILKYIPGYISTEVDAGLSFNTDATVKRAEKIIRIYESEGIERERILIKIAATWEGACIRTGGGVPDFAVCRRILDWYKEKHKTEQIAPADDPGVEFVRSVYTYYKTHSYQTVVMGASFRNTGEITELAGCDRLTISPALLDELAASQATVPQKLSPSVVSKQPKRKNYNESDFRNEFNDNLMAVEKLAEGIMNFKKDYRTLLNAVSAKYLLNRL
ncbi:hypothetical protein CHS0354_035371 [Potamilus streckersoni]|uniref:transaldolase n=1 Tax=Potamilus streckersoni TaxID=2493646 RepID=A0AAE0S3I6_9BIVA|nr:hypothetical protein CHS0354_035371 [Potamilus streckersoni]